MMRTSCPGCGRGINLPLILAGTVIDCPHPGCGRQIRIPDTPPQEPDNDSWRGAPPPVRLRVQDATTDAQPAPGPPVTPMAAVSLDEMFGDECGTVPGQPQMIRFRCPTCNAVLKVPDVKAGAKKKCPSCGQRVRAPHPLRKTVPGQLPSGPRPRLAHSPPQAIPASVRVVCPHCRRDVDIAPALFGTVAACPHGGCGGAMSIPPAAPAAQPLVPAERCYDCGKVIPEGEVCRREVEVSTSHHSGSTYTFGWGRSFSDSISASGTYGGSSSTYATVSLCPPCDAQRDADEEAARLARAAARARANRALAIYAATLFLVIATLVLLAFWPR
jgi:hypothetical protein